MPLVIEMSRKSKAPKYSKEGIQLTLAPARAGKMGSLDLGRDYMAGIRARARMLRKATRFDGDGNGC